MTCLVKMANKVLIKLNILIGNYLGYVGNLGLSTYLCT